MRMLITFFKSDWIDRLCGILITVLHFLLRWLRSAPILILFSVIIILFEYAAAYFISTYTGEDFDPKKITLFIYFNIYTFLCYFVAPFLLNQCIYREKLKNLGLAFPQRKWATSFWMILSLAFLLPFLGYFSTRPEFQEFYSVKSIPRNDFLLMQFILLPLYYIPEEFFFRGFLFLLLWKKVRWHSFWITDIIFAAAHILKPGLEILLSMPASIIFNLLTLYSRSIVPAIIVHSIVGMSLNFFVYYF